MTRIGGRATIGPMAQDLAEHIAANAILARRWLTCALAAEVDGGFMGEREAIDVATRRMRDNQYECFGVEAKRAAIEAMG